MEKQDRNSDSAPELVTAQECKPSTAAAANCGCQPPTFWNSASVSAARHTSAAAALCGQPGRHEPHPNPSVHEPSLTELTWELLLWRDHLESLSTLQMPCPPPPTTARPLQLGWYFPGLGNTPVCQNLYSECCSGVFGIFRMFGVFPPKMIQKIPEHCPRPRISKRCLCPAAIVGDVCLQTDADSRFSKYSYLTSTGLRKLLKNAPPHIHPHSNPHLGAGPPLCFVL